jgi:hypothetical protein
MNLQVPENVGVAAQLATSQEGLNFTKLVS